MWPEAIQAQCANPRELEGRALERVEMRPENVRVIHRQLSKYVPDEKSISRLTSTMVPKPFSIDQLNGVILDLIARGRPQAEAKPSRETPITASLSTSEKHILVVDDDAVTRDLLKRELAGKGYRVTLTDGVDAAFDVLTMPTVNVDLILCDIEMPGRNGLTMLDTLNHLLNPIPIIFVTGSPKAVEEADIKAAFFAVVRKPIDFPRLEKMIHEILV